VSRMRIVIALGGNAMTAPDGSARPEDQQRAVERTMPHIAALVAAGHEVVITHGNGPQVGNLLVKNEVAASVVPPVPLDWCDAQTQGTIGALIMNALGRSLADRGLPPNVAALVSRTLVDQDDPAFAKPTKPIGRFLPRDEAAVLIAHGEVWQDRGAKGWRRVVASPEPHSCVDADAARVLLEAGYVVTCGGGGGIPVVADGVGGYRGVEAVIDKDLTAALLADTLNADVLIIATDVEHAVLGFETPEAQPLGEVSVAELRGYAEAGEFAGGSMLPKVEAGCRFASHNGRFAVITSLEHIEDALTNRVGTIIRGRTRSDSVRHTGAEIRTAALRGEAPHAWMGREGGLGGPRVAADIASGKWMTVRYDVATEPTPSSWDWFPVSEFLATLEAHLARLEAAEPQIAEWLAADSWVV
jgi:carbamate kinase